MTTPFPFVSGAVLTAQQLNDITNLPINDRTASYILVVGDAGKRVIMNNAGATTITVNNSVFTTGDTIFIANKGAGTSTITAGAGVTINPAGSLAVTQYGGGTLVALSASTFQFFPAGVRNTLAVDFLLVGGGGGGNAGAQGANVAGGGGGGGGFVTGSGIIGKTTYTVKVGAGGAGTTFFSRMNSGTASSFIGSANGGGGGAPSARQGANGGSGGGGGANPSSTGGAGGDGVSGEGNNGGSGVSSSANAGGGGGGAGGTGSNGSGTTGGAGGAASTNNYTGTTISYSGGGGGGGSATGGTGGTNAANGGSGGTPSAATANRGGGGGGNWAEATAGSNGGSGRVVVRWLTADATGLSISATGTTTNGTDGSYTWYAWDSTGTLVVA